MSKEQINPCLCQDSNTEVELISLTFERLPTYRLKENSKTEFAGYQPIVFEEAELINQKSLNLTNKEVEKKLEYFLLCGLKICKMTETYEDYSALKLLVEEQKAHMDEAANIGLNLLQRNIQLEQRVNTVEDQLISSKETINQLKHQLHLKDNLLRLLHNEIEEAEDTNLPITESVLFESKFPVENIEVKNLEKKVATLEEENAMFRNRQSSVSSHTDVLESKEQQLIDDCVRQLLDSTKTVERLSSELNKKTNDYLNQHEEISRLLATNIDLDHKVHQLLTENDNLITQLRDQQTKQFTLTKELSELRDRYDECINLLNERQDYIRQLKKKCKREVLKQVPSYRSGSPDFQFAPSLAMEFEESVRKNALSAEHSRTMRMMEQARTVNSSLIDTDETSSGFTEDLSCSNINTEMDVSVQGSLSGGNYLLRKSIQDDCERRRIGKSIPSDLENSLFDLQTELNSTATIASYCTLEAYRHHQNRCQTVRSLNTHILNSEQNNYQSNSIYRIPDKLQLVKPIEGSHTLRTWQNLATPSITKALFEEQSHSVCFRGQQPLLMSPLSPSPKSEHSQLFLPDQNQFSSVNSSNKIDIVHNDAISNILCCNTTTSTFTYMNSKIPNSMVEYGYNRNERLVGHITTPIISDQHHSTNSNFNISSDFTNSLKNSDLTNGTGNYESFATIMESKVDDQFSKISRSSETKKPLICQKTLPSWLDGLTVKSIMNNILGYPLPHISRSITYSSNNKSSLNQIPHASLTSTTSSTASTFSIIGRLTNLPPLAQRRYPQAGLNLVINMSSSNSEDRIVHRIANINDQTSPESNIDDSSSPKSDNSQLD